MIDPTEWPFTTASIAGVHAGLLGDDEATEGFLRSCLGAHVDPLRLLEDLLRLSELDPVELERRTAAIRRALLRVVR